MLDNVVNIVGGEVVGDEVFAPELRDFAKCGVEKAFIYRTKFSLS